MRKLDLLGPYAGPCLACGSRDSRHKLGKIIMNRRRAGEPLSSLALDLGIDAENIHEFVRANTRKKREPKQK